jgi:hypothetical protein
MILLHNPNDKESRLFYNQNKNNFDSILTFPECVEIYPNVSKFPAVVENIEEYVIDNSLYGMATSLPNYNYFAVRVGYLIDLHSQYLQVGANAGGFCSQGGTQNNPAQLWFAEYATTKGWTNDKILYLVESINLGDIPAFLLAWTYRDFYKHGKFEITFDGNVGLMETPYSETISENSQQRCITTLSETGPLTKTIPAHVLYCYPNEFSDIADYKTKHSLRKRIF